MFDDNKNSRVQVRLRSRLDFMSHLEKQISLNTALPFSQTASESEVRQHAQELLARLEISAAIQIINGNSGSGLEHERRFRLSWWMSGAEPMRIALHRAKARAAQQAVAERRESALTQAWQETERVTNSQGWREHFRALARQISFDDRQYLQRFFRLAQLFWNRAARWEAIFSSSSSSPFTSFIALLACGVLPLGCHDRTLGLFVWNKASWNTFDFGPNPAPLYSTKQSYIFFSAPFRDAAMTERWREAFHAKGWKTVHGPINEEAPPELELAKQIAAATAVVGLLNELDADFGLPWWMLQELDCACFCQRPVALITGAKNLDIALEGLRQIQDTRMSQDAPREEHEVWQWLKSHAL